jgi:glycosyltransferase involved in cell wall biosynthesis
MACGTPVVTTEIGVDYGIDHENVMFVPPENGMAIADAVSELFDNSELRRKLMLNGIQVAHDRTWEKEQKQFIDIINRLVEK